MTKETIFEGKIIVAKAEAIGSGDGIGITFEELKGKGSFEIGTLQIKNCNMADFSPAKLRSLKSITVIIR